MPAHWSADEVAASKRSRSDLCADGGAVYWAESRPEEEGRVVVVRAQPGGPAHVVSPEGVGVRSRVHEYGGGAFVVADGDLIYVDSVDQGVWAVAIDGAQNPRRVTPADATARYADPVVVVRHGSRWVIVIEERAVDARATHRVVATRVPDGLDGEVGVDRETEDLAPPVVLYAGADFVAAPRVSPDGALLAWMSWDHPAMPWDSSVIHLARLVDDAASGLALADECAVVGGDGSAVGPPAWLADGTLVVVEDSSGWWMPYAIDPHGLDGVLSGNSADGAGATRVPLLDLEGEYTAPHWIFGRRALAEGADGQLYLVRRVDGKDELIALDRESGATRVVAQPLVGIESVVACPEGGVALLGATPTVMAAVVVCAAEVQWCTPEQEARPAAVAEAVAVESAHGSIPGLLYLPEDRLPPLVVACHGGPTASAQPGFDPWVQFLVSHGIAVAVVDYRGSTGHGRAYREALAGGWGVADVEDCVAYARGLAAEDRVDGRRMAIRGSSAGGMTALLALAHGTFAGAVSLYGVTELAALAAETHEFESRYIDGLVGPWPEAADLYRERSPAQRVRDLEGALLLLQGDDDHVVPLSQAQAFAQGAEAAGVDCALVVYAGEGHGFRRAETIADALGRELDFYRTLFQLESRAGAR